MDPKISNKPASMYTQGFEDGYKCQIGKFKCDSNGNVISAGSLNENTPTFNSGCDEEFDNNSKPLNINKLFGGNSQSHYEED